MLSLMGSGGRNPTPGFDTDVDNTITQLAVTHLLTPFNWD